jgi:hypothetical protein
LDPIPPDVVLQQFDKFSFMLKKRVKAFLRGLGDPAWDFDVQKGLNLQSGAEPKARFQRLIQLLYTVEGCFY